MRKYFAQLLVFRKFHRMTAFFEKRLSKSEPKWNFKTWIDKSHKRKCKIIKEMSSKYCKPRKLTGEIFKFLI